jgi:hypothetical protein
MKKNKIAIFTIVALLAVGSVFGTKKMIKKDMQTVYYIAGSTCTAINCSPTTTGTPYCVTATTQFYESKINGVCTTPIGEGLSKPFVGK